MSSPYHINKYGQKIIENVIHHHFSADALILCCTKTPGVLHSTAMQFYYSLACELAYIQFVRNGRDFFEIVFPGYLTSHGRTFFITLDKTHFSYDPCPPKTD